MGEAQFRITTIATERHIEHAFTVTPDDGGYFVEFPDLPGCMTQAENLAELVVMVPDAYWLWRETADENGYKYPTAASGRGDDDA